MSLRQLITSKCYEYLKFNPTLSSCYRCETLKNLPTMTGTNYIEFDNGNICCNFSFTTSGYQSPTSGNHDDGVLYHYENVTWPDLREFMSNDTGGVTLHCVMAGTNLTTDHDLDYTNLSIVSQDSYLERFLGPKRHDELAEIFLAIIYVVIFLTGVLGNVCTCIVISRNRFMQTATNYYLFNMAVSDMVTLMAGE